MPLLLLSKFGNLFGTELGNEFCPPPDISDCLDIELPLSTVDITITQSEIDQTTNSHQMITRSKLHNNPTLDPMLSHEISKLRSPKHQRSIFATNHSCEPKNFRIALTKIHLEPS